MIVDFPETYEKVGPALVRTGVGPKKTLITDGLASSELPKSWARRNRGHAGHGSGRARQRRCVGVVRQGCITRRGPGRQMFDAQDFDAVVLCYLTAVAAGNTDGKEMAAKLQEVSGPGGTKYTFEQLPDAIKDLQDGKDINYEGASGPLDLNEQGDPTSGVYDIYRYKDGKIDVFDELPVEPPQ